MNRAFSLIVAIAIGLTFSHCGGRPSDGAGKAEVRTQTYRSSAAAHTDNQPFTEDFEKGTKAGYADGVVTLGTGSWQFTDALCAQSENDHGNGAKCVRLKGNGSITMLFDLPGGAKDVTIATALYGHDAACTWALWMSTDGGQTWAQTGEEQTTSSATPLQPSLPSTVVRCLLTPPQLAPSQSPVRLHLQVCSMLAGHSTLTADSQPPTQPPPASLPQSLLRLTSLSVQSLVLCSKQMQLAKSLQQYRELTTSPLAPSLDIRSSATPPHQRSPSAAVSSQAARPPSPVSLPVW